MRSKCESCSHCIWDEYGFGLCKLDLDEETCEDAEELTLEDVYNTDLELVWAERRSDR